MSEESVSGAGGAEGPAASAGAGSPAEPGGGDRETTFRCDLCGGPMLDRHCKLLCLQCGYQRDCSDP